MGTNITGLGNANAIGFKSKVSGGGRYLPPELKDSLKAVVICDGKTNTDLDRAVLRNLVDSSNPFVASNFGWSLNSGYGKYSEEFDADWIIHANQTGVVKTDTTVKVVSDISNTYLIYHEEKKATNSFKVKVTGLKNQLRYTYVDSNSTVQNVYFTSDGTYDINASAAVDNSSTSQGFYINPILNYTGLVLEILPDFDGALVFDGVDDKVESIKTVEEMVSDTNALTVVSLIASLQDTVARTNFFGTNSAYLETVFTNTSNGKLNIVGYTSTDITNNITKFDSILGDKGDWNVRIVKDNTGNEQNKLSIAGLTSGGTFRAASVAWYWTIIANKVLTTDEIHQVIAYYNLDKHVKPDIYYDVKKQGITNENHTTFNNKLIDYSGNGYDMRLYNIGWSGGSGIGNYPVEFGYNKTWQEITYNNFTADLSSNKSVISQLNTNIGYMYSYIANAGALTNYNTIKNAFRLKISGISANNKNFYLQYRYLATAASTAVSIISMKVDGIYNLPKSFASDGTILNSSSVAWVGFVFVRIGTVSIFDDIDVTLEIIPDNEGSLVLDGVDDYGRVNNIPVKKDYTVVAEREILNPTKGSFGFISDREDGTGITAVSTFVFEKNATPISYSFGSSTSITRNNDNIISYQSKYVYNGKTISAGSQTGNNKLLIGAGIIRDNVIGEYANTAMKFMMLFPYSLNEFLIERQLKKRKLGTLHPDMIEFRPYVTVNGEISKIDYFLNDWTAKLNPGDYIAAGSTVNMNIYATNNINEFSALTINKEPVSFIPHSTTTTNNYISASATYNKSPMKIVVWVDDYIRYEDLNFAAAYPFVPMLVDNDVDLTWGDKLKIGSVVDYVGYNNTLKKFYTTNDTMKLNGNPIANNSQITVTKNMVFSICRTWTLDDNEPKVILSPYNLRIPNSSYKLLGYIPDLSGHGNKGIMHNFSYKLMSGANGYTYDYSDTTQFYVHNDTLVELIDDHTIKYFAIKDIVGFLKRSNTYSGKIKVTGLGNAINRNEATEFRMYTNSTDSSKTELVTITKDGTYDINIKGLDSTANNVYFYIPPTKGVLTLTEPIIIEQVGNYEGSMVFDGVEDYVTVETSGGRQMFMKFNNLSSVSCIAYDQRATGGTSEPFALMIEAATTNIYRAYQSRNIGGQSYIDGIVNPNMPPIAIKGLMHNVTMTNNYAEDVAVKDSVLLGNSVLGSSYTKMVMQTLILFDNVSTANSITAINNKIGIDGNVVKWNPTVTTNQAYKSISYSIVTNTDNGIVNATPTTNGLFRLGATLHIYVTPQDVNAVSAITVNNVAATFVGVDVNNRYEYTTLLKANQNINITIDDYVAYEDIQQPYPVLFKFLDENNEEVSWGGRLRLGSTAKLVGSVDDTENNLMAELYNVSGLTLNDVEVTGDTFTVSKNMVFKTNVSYVFSNSNAPKCVLSPSRLRIPNSSYKKLGYIPDISGNGNNGVLHNFAYSLASGANGYNEDFTTWHKYSNIVVTDSAIYTITPFNDNWLIYKSSSTNSISAMKIKVTGIPTGGNVQYRYIATADDTTYSALNMSSDGTYDLPASVVNTNNVSVGFLLSNYITLDYTNIRIEQVPNYAGSIVLDGVDDYINVPTTTGGKQVLLKVNRQNNGIVYDQRATTGILVWGLMGVAYSLINKGITYIDGILNKNVTCADLLNVTHNITVTDSSGSSDTAEVPTIGKSVTGTNYSKMAIYDMIVFPDISTEDEIKELNEIIGIEGGYVENPNYYWDAYGKSNSDADKNILVDKVSNNADNALTLTNIDYEGMSGYNGYPVVFGDSKTWNLIRTNSNTTNNYAYELSSSKVTLSKLTNAMPFFMFSYIKQSNALTAYNKEIPSFKIKVTGIDSTKFAMRYYYLSAANSVAPSNYLIISNGTYELPKSFASDGSLTAQDVLIGLSFSYTSAFVDSDAVNVILEIIPDYENGLALNGVNNYLVNSLIPAYTDFTVITKRTNLLDSYEDGVMYIMKGLTNDKWALLGDYWSGGSNTQYSFGQTNVAAAFADTGYITPTSYNGKAITKGTGEDSVGIQIGGWSKFWKGVFYKMMLFDRTIDSLSINMLKNLFAVDGIIDVTSRLFKKSS